MRPTALICVPLMAVFAHSITKQAAATVPFTENFTGSVSNWTDGSGANLATFLPSGGPDGSSHASSNATAFNVADNAAVVLFRGQDEFNSSGHAFEGDWLGTGINHFSAYVRHNAPVSLDFFIRFATPSNFPGTAADRGILIPPNTWTQLSYDILASNINSPSNPGGYLFPEGPSSFFNSTFSNVGHIQIGYSVPAGFGADPNSYTFGLDQPSIVPEPASWFLMIGFVATALLRRRCAA